MSLTVEALATAISQIDDIDPEFAAMIATGLLPFIERHIAAGRQGAGDDDVLEMLCRLERLAVVHRVNGSVEWKLLVEQAADMIRRLATPQPAGCGACGDDCKGRGSCRLADESPKPAGAVPDPLDAAIAKGTKAWADVPDSFVEDLRGEAAGRADAVLAYCEERGEAGNRYHASFKTAHPLPQQWLWEECWNAMISAIPQQPAAVNQPMTTQGEGAGREAVAWLDLAKLKPSGMVYATGFKVSDNQSPLYTNPSPVADAEAQDDTEARKLYSKWTDSHDKIHCNRFPSWSDLGEEDRAEWRDKAARLTGSQS